MKNVKIELTIPEGMLPYLSDDDCAGSFERNAMMLFPFIQNLTISYGRAAEILGVCKTDLIEYYDSLGIPYLNQERDEIMIDVDTINQALGAAE